MFDLNYFIQHLVAIYTIYTIVDSFFSIVGSENDYKL